MDAPTDPATPSLDPTPPQWQLRVLNGPARGTICVVGHRLAIGRAGSSDLQLADHEISRQHARIVRDEQGQHVIEDLASRNGTLVAGEAIQRRPLEPYDVITIVETELIYEPVPMPSTLTHPSERHADMRTLRGTAEVPAMVARTHAPTTPVGAAVPAWAVTDRDGRALVFERPDGGEYEGNLVDDVIEYRMLRAQHLRGGFSDAASLRRFETLKGVLVQPASADPLHAQRAFCRFGCWLPALLREATGAEHPCQIRDIGVDGAQLLAADHELAADSIVWLAIEVIEGGQPRSIVLAGRVAWADDDFVGLAFAGSQRRVEGRYTEQPGRVRREFIEERTVPKAVPLRLSVEPSGS